MAAHLFSVLAPVMVAVLAGYFWARKGQPFDRDMVSRLVMVLGAPCLIVSTLDQTRLSVQALADVLFAYAAVLLVTVIASVVMLRLCCLPWRSWFNVLVFPNVGNMGLPLCLLAFGDTGLALALAWFMVNSLLHFSIAPLVASGERDFLAFLRHPIIWSVAAALAMIATDASLPDWLANTVSLVGGFTIPLMLITLGVSLYGLPLKHLRVATLVSLLRLGLGLLAAWLVCEWLGLDGVLRGVVMVQSSMPVAVFNYLFAERYQRDASAVAASVLVSTVLSFMVLVPLLSLLLPDAG
ncbi:MAG: AEC family transporter [Alcanivoracaceae bacterium]|nr:AEC family transporter [Alcanivoracaceae bacterium]